MKEKVTIDFVSMVIFSMEDIEWDFGLQFIRLMKHYQRV